MPTTTPKFADHAAAFVAAALNLVDAIAADDREIAACFASAAAVRVALDSGERVALITLVDRHGRGQPFLAVTVDERDPDTFGDIGVPAPVFDLHADRMPS